MINGNYFGNKGLLVSWSLFRAPKEKAESQEMLSPGRTCNIRGGKSWIGKWCWACILKWIIIISHGLIWRAFPDGSGGWLSHQQDVGVVFVAAVRVGVQCWGCVLWAPGNKQPHLSRLLPPIPSVLGRWSQSEAVFLLWFAALNRIWSLCWPCFVQKQSF